MDVMLPTITRLANLRSTPLRDYRADNPWIMPRYYAMRRCTDKKHKEYKNYGGRGIEFHLTLEEAKLLWFRDKAYLMDKASLDRIDPDEDYCLLNCRFMELVDNIARKRPRGKNRKGANGCR